MKHSTSLRMALFCASLVLPAGFPGLAVAATPEGKPAANWLQRLEMRGSEKAGAAGYGNPVPGAALGNPASPAAAGEPIITAQASDAAFRINQLEEQVRVLNGQVEEMNFQLLQLQEQLRKMQEDNEFRFQELEDRSDASGSAIPWRTFASRGSPSRSVATMSPARPRGSPSATTAPLPPEST